MIGESIFFYLTFFFAVQKFFFEGVQKKILDGKKNCWFVLVGPTFYSEGSTFFKIILLIF